jgi:glycosyltransferase involved in cell wall biosynthesis
MADRLLVFIPAYNATSTIDWVLDRIPADLTERFQLHVLIIDDASADDTGLKAKAHLEGIDPPWDYTILVNPENRGYGGNQKLGYTFAIENSFDFVVMVHGDGQYPPEAIGELATTLTGPNVGAAFGSRFLRRHGARDGGMPLYKRIANRFLTSIQNRFLNTNLSEFHSGFRAYSVPILARLPFQLNSDDFEFDTEIIIQLARAGVEIAEIDIPTYYGDEVCYVNGPIYGLNVLGQTLRAFVHDKGMFYEAKYDLTPPEGREGRYETKTDFASPTTLAARFIADGERVLDLGAGRGGLAELLSKNCQMFGVDIVEPENVDDYDRFWRHDLNSEASLPLDLPSVDTIVLLDVVEHLHDPEKFVAELAEYCERVGTVQRVFASTGNVGFGVIRAALLVGQFNYGGRGILDRTHTRLFTYGSFRRLFRAFGFKLVRAEGVPAPFPLAIRNRRLALVALHINEWLIRLGKGLFSYQIFLELSPPVAQTRLLEASNRVSVNPPIS